MNVPGRAWSSLVADWRYASPLGQGERTKVRSLELLLLVALHRPSPSPSPGRGDPGLNIQTPTQPLPHIALKSYCQWHQ